MWGHKQHHRITALKVFYFRTEQNTVGFSLGNSSGDEKLFTDYVIVKNHTKIHIQMLFTLLLIIHHLHHWGLDPIHGGVM